MSDWTEAVVAKAQLKSDVLTVYDHGIDAGFDRGEARALCRGLVPEEVEFMRVLVDYWIDTERPCTPEA